ncbi:MAG: hypothetical protein AAF411_18175, partial [Myxococcota bacterium]
MKTLCTFAALALILSASPASAQDGPSYLEQVQDARQRLVAGQLTGAETAARAAAEASPNDPQAHCVLGDIRRIQGNASEALEHYQRCAVLAEAASKRREQARGLIGQQRVFLADPERRDDARRMTTELLRFAEANPEILSAEDVRTRLQTIELITERDAVSAEVR